MEMEEHLPDLYPAEHTPRKSHVKHAVYRLNHSIRQNECAELIKKMKLELRAELLSTHIQ